MAVSGGEGCPPCWRPSGRAAARAALDAPTRHRPHAQRGSRALGRRQAGAAGAAGSRAHRLTWQTGHRWRVRRRQTCRLRRHRRAPSHTLHAGRTGGTAGRQGVTLAVERNTMPPLLPRVQVSHPVASPAAPSPAPRPAPSQPRNRHPLALPCSIIEPSLPPCTPGPPAHTPQHHQPHTHTPHPHTTTTHTHHTTPPHTHTHTHTHTPAHTHKRSHPPALP